MSNNKKRDDKMRLTTYAIRFNTTDGYQMEKLIGSGSKTKAIEDFKRWFPDTELISVRKCTKRDSGSFRNGLAHA